MEGNKSNQEMQGLCKEGCGFYGSSANEGFCSQCFKKRLRRWLHMNEPSTPTATTTPSSVPLSSSISTTASESPLSKVQDDTPSPSPLLAPPTVLATPTTLITTRTIISSSVDRAEYGGEDSEEEVIICSSSIDKEDNKDKHKNDDNKEKHKNVDNDNNNEDMFVQKTETKKDEDALNLSTVTLDDNTKIEIEKGDDSTDLPSLEDLSEASSSVKKDVVLSTVAEDTEGETKVKRKNRCFMCNKKVGLTGFSCRCGDVFCGQHRYSDTHHCPFDYKSLGKQEIEKNNPKVAFEKVTKI